MTEAAWLREELFPYLEQGYCLFSFNFTEVESIDSSGIGILLALQKKQRRLVAVLAFMGFRRRFEQGLSSFPYHRTRIPTIE